MLIVSEHLSPLLVAIFLHGVHRAFCAIYLCSASPASTRILPVALVLDHHTDLELHIHLLNLDLHIWQKLFALPGQKIPHPCSQLQDLGLRRIAVDVENCVGRGKDNE